MCDSFGQTSRNQPMRPKNKQIAPKALNIQCVSIPAQSIESPKAATNGQPPVEGTRIRAPSSKGSLRCSGCGSVSMRFKKSPTNQINYRENDDPDDIHEMPIDGENF